MLIKIVPAVGLDEYGDPEDPGTETVLHGAYTAPAGTVDVDGRGREGHTDTITLFAPAGVELAHDDRIRIDGDLYVIDGTPQVWTRPRTGQIRGVVANLRRSVG